MTITAHKTDLQRALNLCQGIAERRTTIPILCNLLLQRSAGDGALTITATDMDMELSVTIDAEVGKKFAPFTLPVHTLADIVKKTTAEKITIAAETAAARIVAGNAKFSLGTLPVEDFPAFAHPETDAEFTVPAAVLLDLIDRVQYCISNEETRYYLNGIYFCRHEDEGRSGFTLRAVATDGHQLAYADGVWDGASLPDFIPAILPRKACAELKKMLDGVDGDVAVRIAENRASFAVPGLRLSTKLVDGTFPDYYRVIPKGNDVSVVIETAKLSAAAARVATICETKTRCIRLSFDKKTLTLSARGDQGSAEELIDLKEQASVKDPAAAFVIGINAAYLQDALAHMGAEVEFLMADPASPVILHTLDNGARNLNRLHLLMPMRV